MNITEYKKHYEVYQYSATGVFGYEFYDGDIAVGSASSIVELMPAVSLTTDKFILKSEYKSPINVTVGDYRSIINLYDNSVFANIIYNGNNSFTIQNWNSEITVICDDVGYKFFVGNDLIGHLKKSVPINKTDYVNYFNLTKFFDFYAFDSISEELLIIFLAIPILNFVI